MWSLQYHTDNVMRKMLCTGLFSSALTSAATDTPAALTPAMAPTISLQSFAGTEFAAQVASLTMLYANMYSNLSSVYSSAPICTEQHCSSRALLRMSTTSKMFCYPCPSSSACPLSSELRRLMSFCMSPD